MSIPLLPVENQAPADAVVPTSHIITSASQDKLMGLLIDFAGSTCIHLQDKTTKEMSDYFNTLITVVDHRLDDQLNAIFDDMKKIKLGYGTHHNGCQISHHVDLIQMIVLMVLAYTGDGTNMSPWVWLENNFRSRAWTLSPCDHVHEPINGKVYEFEIVHA